ncbi:MAG TPA: alkaline shock response membrane anchor protein AmaP [Firmicutes bacterium]|nr:alkaline shock response membrane anchor protein AmaP [Bacillota bacterium]
MSLVDRILLVLYTLLFAMFSVVVVMASLGWKDVLESTVGMITTGNTRWAAGLLGIAFFGVSVKLLYAAFRPRYLGQTVVHETPLGEVRVALEAIEGLVKRVVRQVDGVRDVRGYVSTNAGVVNVDLYVAVSPETSIPTTSEEIQTTVKNQVRNVVGVNVGTVRVSIEGITNEARRGKVE